MQRHLLYRHCACSGENASSSVSCQQSRVCCCRCCWALRLASPPFRRRGSSVSRPPCSLLLRVCLQCSSRLCASSTGNFAFFKARSTAVGWQNSRSRFIQLSKNPGMTLTFVSLRSTQCDEEIRFHDMAVAQQQCILPRGPLGSSSELWGDAARHEGKAFTPAYKI